MKRTPLKRHIPLKKNLHRDCEFCGASFPLARSSRLTTRFCSNRCAGKSRIVSSNKRFSRYYVAGNAKDCWLWMGSRSPQGYGKFHLENNKYIAAHRFSYQEKNGAIPDGLCVLHSCDNPPCVNPGHLFLGTPQDNVDDRTSKGRHGCPRGSAKPEAKLNEHDIIEIRRDSRPNSVIAEDYGVSRENIYQIKCRKIWKHVHDDPKEPSSVHKKIKYPRRTRNYPKRVWPDHDDYIRSLPCTFCGRPPRSVQMHISTAANSGKAIKAPSWASIPSCDADHKDAHQRGHVTKAREHGIDGLAGLLAIAAMHAEGSPDGKMKDAMRANTNEDAA